MGWFDSEKEEFVFRAVITDVTKFLQVEKLNPHITVEHSFDLTLGGKNLFARFISGKSCTLHGGCSPTLPADLRDESGAS